VDSPSCPLVGSHLLFKEAKKSVWQSESENEHPLGFERMIAKDISSDKVFQQLLDEIVDSAKLNGELPDEIWLFLTAIADQLPSNFLPTVQAIISDEWRAAA